MNFTSRPAAKAPSPAELRDMLGANLRELTRDCASISAVCRDLGINRTQFNRYLAGESFPRPDVLDRICRFFRVDARILLQPVDQIDTARRDVLHHPAISDFIGSGATARDENAFPLGFYRFTRLSFMVSDRFLQGLVYVFRRDRFTFIRGFETKEVMRGQGLPADAGTREFRGFVMPQECGFAALVSRRNSLTTSFNYLVRIPSIENNHWVGYTVRTAPESVSGRRMTRLVYEHLGTDGKRVRSAARSSGLCTADSLLPFHRAQLQIGEPLT